MKKDGFYSSGEFAKMAHITKKTLRYYDAHNILKPILQVNLQKWRILRKKHFAIMMPTIF